MHLLYILYVLYNIKGRQFALSVITNLPMQWPQSNSFTKTHNVWLEHQTGVK